MSESKDSVGYSQKITKTKTVRVNLSGSDFLNFHSISGCVVFPEKISERAYDEELVKIAIRRLKAEIDRRREDGELFISADSLQTHTGQATRDANVLVRTTAESQVEQS